ncbi:MAG: hypothetical protein IKP66_10475, partial [Lachnospiraceae bacterium]|nr:hypothetical protein [Lachnospiraceae bacterium]
MLKGLLQYKVDANTIYEYDVKGSDAATLSLILTARKYSGKRFMCNPNSQPNDYYDGEDDDFRRVDIKLAKVNVQTGKHTENGKQVKNAINSDFFCQLGAVIRYVKNQCNKKNEKYFTGVSLASKEFEVITETEYVIKKPNTQDVLAEIKLNLGCISEIHLNAPTMTLDLIDDKSLDEYLPTIKDGIAKGIKFDYEYLGFEPQPTVVANVTSV